LSIYLDLKLRLRTGKLNLHAAYVFMALSNNKGNLTLPSLKCTIFIRNAVRLVCDQYLTAYKRKLGVRITAFVDIVHLPVFKMTRKHNISETGCIPIFS
jgi:hypothetical protein